MQFGHDDSPMAESLRQKNRSGGGGASFVPFEYNYFPYATQLISSGVFKRYALDRIAPTICCRCLHQSWHGHCYIPVESPGESLARVSSY